MIEKLLTEHHLEFLSLIGGCRGSSEYTLVKMPHCWKSHVMAQLFIKQDGSRIPKIRLNMQCTGFVMLQLSNCCLEDLNAWSNCNISWEGIPLGNSQWKEGVFVVVLASMDLSGNSWRSYVWAVCGQEGALAIYNFVEGAAMDHRSSLFNSLSVHLRLQGQLGWTSLDQFGEEQWNWFAISEIGGD